MRLFMATWSQSVSRTVMTTALGIGMLGMSMSLAAGAGAWGNSAPEIAPEDSVGVNVLEPGTSFAAQNRSERMSSNQETILLDWNYTAKKPPKGSPKG